MASSYRKLTPEDFPSLLEALKRWLALAPCYGYCDKPNLEKAFVSIYNKHLQGDAYVVEEKFLLLVSEVTPDFGDDSILQENLVLSLSPGGKILDAVDALEDIGRTRGVDHISLSDSSIGIKLSKVYQRRRGYRLITHKLFKDL